MEKSCQICGKTFRVSPSNFVRRKTCGRTCKYVYLGKLLSETRKGVYSKGHKFEKGHPTFVKNYKKGVHYSPETEFKKGLIPWNRNRVGIMPIPWNKGLGNGCSTQRNKEMKSWKYKNWRNFIFSRDNYTCKKCGERGGRLIADHIKMWALYPELRYETNNGQTLCKKCSNEKTRKELRIHWRNQYQSSLIKQQKDEQIIKVSSLLGNMA